MRAVIQRISHGEVRVKGETVGEINQGLCVMLGVLVTDGEAQCDHLAEKISNLRIFEDDNQKMNRSVKDIQGGVLAISNFTLCTENKKSGNRPSFILAARPEQGAPLPQVLRKAEGIRGGENGPRDFWRGHGGFHSGGRTGYHLDGYGYQLLIILSFARNN